MGRILTEMALLYLVPFALYMLCLTLRRMDVLAFDRWTRRIIAALSLAGFAMVLCGMVATGFFADRHEGAYAPAHIENGRLLPGEIQ